MQSQDPFYYERLLKTLADALTPEQFDQLRKWKFLHNACETYLSNISIYGTDNEEIQSKDAKAFFKMENEIKNTISEVFLTLPNPDGLGQCWDEGVAKKNAHMHEQAIGELAEFISSEYQLLREVLSNAIISHQEYTRLEQVNNLYTHKADSNSQNNIGLTTQAKNRPSRTDSFFDDDIF